MFFFQFNNNINTRNLKALVKRILIDQHQQHWNSSLQNSEKGRQYNAFKSDLRFEKYLKLLPINLARNIFKLRTDNNRFPVETGRWNGTPYIDRLCLLCNSQAVGNGQHYLLHCDYFNVQRASYLPLHQNQGFNVINNYSSLVTSQCFERLVNVSKLAGIVMNHFR